MDRIKRIKERKKATKTTLENISVIFFSLTPPPLLLLTSIIFTSKCVEKWAFLVTRLRNIPLIANDIKQSEREAGKIVCVCFFFIIIINELISSLSKLMRRKSWKGTQQCIKSNCSFSLFLSLSLSYFFCIFLKAGNRRTETGNVYTFHW